MMKQYRQYFLMFFIVITQPVFGDRIKSDKIKDKTVTFKKGIFNSNLCECILGNSTFGQEGFALMDAYKDIPSIVLLGIAPETCNINGLVFTDTLQKTGDVENTLYCKKVKHIAFMNESPVVAVSDDPMHLFLVDNKETGSEVLKNAVVSEKALEDNIPLTDLKAKVPSEISGLVASSWKIFVALAAKSYEFGAQDSCIRALSRSESNDNLGLDAVTKSISNDAGSEGVQDECGNVLINGLASMHWDSTINRLFIGLDHAQSSTCNVSLLVGRLDSPDSSEIVLSGAIPYVGVLDVGETSTCSKIVGSGNTTCVWPCTVSHITTMSTTTGGLYVIAQVDKGGIDDPYRSKKIFALPIVKTNVDTAKVGTLSVNRTAQGVVTEAEYTIFESAISDVDLQDDPSSFLWSGNDENIEEAAA
ncbi:hypothetical protein KAU11_06015, partial [Candidatus Babeliales bacterium]|nr:hypothetical protein [Candidatus Babeliales bacterium]